MKIRLHYNKQNAAYGLPWTIHTSKGCFPASHVKFFTNVETEERPDKKSNPKYFLVCHGNIRWDGSVAIILDKYRF